jgi:hypothetical protein
LSILRPLARRRHLYELGVELAQHGHQVALRGHDLAPECKSIASGTNDLKSRCDSGSGLTDVVRHQAFQAKLLHCG